MFAAYCKKTHHHKLFQWARFVLAKWSQSCPNDSKNRYFHLFVLRHYLQIIHILGAYVCVHVGCIAPSHLYNVICHWMRYRFNWDSIENSTQVHMTEKENNFLMIYSATTMWCPLHESHSINFILVPKSKICYRSRLKITEQWTHFLLQPPSHWKYVSPAKPNPNALAKCMANKSPLFDSLCMNMCA